MIGSVTHRAETAQGPVTIEPVTTARQRRQFVELPYKLYARDTHWVPPLRRDEHRRLSMSHNPFFEHAQMMLWLATENGRPVGRVAAIEDRRHNETHGERTTFFGFFEAGDESCAQALLDAVEEWGRSHGSTSVRGPVNPSLNEAGGLLIDGFDQDPYILMPYNSREYAEFLNAAGYAKIKDLLAWEIDLTAPIADGIARMAERVRREHGITVRAADLRHFKRDLAIIQTIYRSAWEDNWGFVPPTDRETEQLATDLKPVVDPELVLFAEISGRPVACAVGIPDINQVLKRMNGRVFPFGLWYFLRRRSIITRARLLLLGILPAVRRMGLYPLLMAESHRRAVARGYTRGELSWTLEDNDAINTGIEAAGGRRSKTYRLYEKPLGERERSARGA